MKITNQVKFATSNTLLQIGIPYHIAGTKYLLRAIEIAIENPNSVMLITKKIYQTIAMEFSTKSANVERAIRHAIDTACSKNKISKLNDLFGLAIYEEKDKPSNGEFIALFAERIPYIASQFEI